MGDSIQSNHYIRKKSVTYICYDLNRIMPIRHSPMFSAHPLMTLIFPSTSITFLKQLHTTPRYSDHSATRYFTFGSWNIYIPFSLVSDATPLLPFHSFVITIKIPLPRTLSVAITYILIVYSSPITPYTSGI